MPQFTMCVRLWQQRRASAPLCFSSTETKNPVPYLHSALFSSRCISYRRVLGPFASMSEMNQILSEKGNAVWCNGVEGEMGTFSPIFSVRACVCVCVLGTLQFLP